MFFLLAFFGFLQPSKTIDNYEDVVFCTVFMFMFAFSHFLANIFSVGGVSTSKKDNFNDVQDAS